MPNRNLKMLSGIGQAEIDAYFKRMPAPEKKWKDYFPVVQQLGDNWKTLSNQSYAINVASDPAALGSSAPIKSRKGVDTIQGGFGVFKVARIKDESEIQEFNELQAKSAQFTNPAQFEQILNWMGNDIEFTRNAALSQANFLNWALLSSACDLGYIAANSPQLTSLKNIVYPVSAWQKLDKDTATIGITTTWSNIAATIIDDIENIVDLAETNGKVVTKIKINKTWFKYVQLNTQVQKYASTYVQNALSLQGVPTLGTINSMLGEYFGSDVAFEVIDEKVSREAITGVTTTANPFADGVAVFTAETKVGSFQFKGLTSNPNIISVVEDFYTIERLYQSDPDLEKTLSKFKGMTVIDTYADNVYVKVNNTAW